MLLLYTVLLTVTYSYKYRSPYFHYVTLDETISRYGNLDFSIISTKLIHFWKSLVRNRDTDMSFPKVYQLCRNDGELNIFQCIVQKSQFSASFHEWYALLHNWMLIISNKWNSSLKLTWEDFQQHTDADIFMISTEQNFHHFSQVDTLLDKSYLYPCFEHVFSKSVSTL